MSEEIGKEDSKQVLKDGSGPKDETYYKICNAVLRLQVEKGDLKWRVSDIAKYSGVTRSLIYYYFGKEKEVIYEEAVRFMLDFFLPSPDDVRVGIQARMMKIIGLLSEMPYMFVLYYLEKDQDSTVGELIREREEKVVQRIMKQLNVSRNEALRLYFMELGSVAYKKLNVEQCEEIFSDLKI